MRANRVWLASLAVALLACGSGGGAGVGGNADASGSLEGSVDADGGGKSDDAALVDGSADAEGANEASPDADDGAAPCTGMPQSLNGSCTVFVDPDAAASALLLCIEYTGPDPSLLLTCADLMGTSSTGPCPTTALLGRCLQQCGAPDETVGYDYVASAAAYRQSCESGGGIFLP
jgi:hypothetical protein